MFDYDGDSVLVEHKHYGGERPLSSYTHGPLGVVTRTAEAATATTSDNCTFGYLSDATGHCLGVVPLTAGTPAIEWTRMGERRPGGSRERGSMLCTLPAATQPCSSQPAINAGPYQYHGHDGYETDLIDPQRGVANPDESIGRQTTPDPGRSTGFIHIGVRYYEPATGRFLQRDELPIDPLPFTTGQNNRWAFAGNEPVNSLDHGGNETLINVNITMSISAFLTSMAAGAARVGPTIATWTQYGIGACHRHGVSWDKVEKVLERGGRVFFDNLNGRFNIFSRGIQVVIDSGGRIINAMPRDAPRQSTERFFEITMH